MSAALLQTYGESGPVNESHYWSLPTLTGARFIKSGKGKSVHPKIAGTIALGDHREVATRKLCTVSRHI